MLAWAWLGLVVGCSIQTHGAGTEQGSSSEGTSTGELPAATMGSTSSGGSTGPVADETSSGGVGTGGSTSETDPSTGEAESSTGPVGETDGGPQQVEYCVVPGLGIPDANPEGVISSLDVDLLGGGVVLSLELVVEVSHSYVGDLRIELRKDLADGVLILDRPGNGDCSGDDIDAVFRDTALATVDGACMNGVSPALSGEIQPETAMDPALAGLQMVGTWRLHVTDPVPNDTGTLDAWCLRITYR